MLLGGCGTAGPAAPSALDPANLAPASTLLYASVTVRPQGSLATRMRQTLTKLLGPGADRSLLASVDKGLRTDGLSYARNVRPWLGQRVGLILTEFPQPGMPSGATPPGMALIMPTKDPSAARAFLRKLIRRNPGTQGRVANGYAVYGGALAYQQTLGLTPADSLVDSPGYRASTSQLGPDLAATVYLNLHRFAQISAQRGGMNGSVGGLLKQSLARIGPNAAVAAGLKLSPAAISLDTVETGVAPGPRQTADVGQLPAGSWLALSTGSAGASYEKRLRAGVQFGLLGALSSQGVGGSAVAGAMTRELGFFERDVLPALGPMSLAVGGTSPLNLMAGLKLAPSSLPAATRLLGALRAQAARSPALSVSGKVGHFSVKVPTGSRLVVNEIHRLVVATYGFASPAAFLSPQSRLAGDPSYQRAVSQLPAGSSVPLYVSFAPITTLVALADHQPSAARMLRVLRALDYLIAGGVSGHTRMVLGLR